MSMFNRIRSPFECLLTSLNGCEQNELSKLSLDRISRLQFNHFSISSFCITCAQKYPICLYEMALLHFRQLLRRNPNTKRWVTVSGSIPGAGHLFQYVTDQPPKANSALHPSGVGKWVPASAGKAKAGMVHSVHPLRTRAIPERLRGVFTTRRYTNPRLPLPLPNQNLQPRFDLGWTSG